MPIQTEIGLLIALVLTVQIELGVLVLMREHRANVLGLSVVVNVLTNLSLNLWLNAYYYDVSVVELLMAEAGIVVIEALAYRCVVSSWRQAFIYSVLCNAISFLTGVLLELHCPLWFEEVI